MHKGKIMLKKTDVVYLSGPMSDLPDCNIPAFYAAEKILRNTYGCEVLNPARQPKGLSYCEYMRRALNDLEWATAVVVLPRALESIGAGFEIAVACKKLNLSVYRLDQKDLILLWHGKEQNHESLQ